MNNSTDPFAVPPGWEPDGADHAAARRILDEAGADGYYPCLTGALIATIRIVARNSPPGSLPPASAHAIRLAFALHAAAAHPDRH